MFKRFQVLNLFDETDDKAEKDWVDVSEEKPEEKSGIFFVKCDDSTIRKAYFCEDSCYPISRHIKADLSQWWDKTSQEPISNVTHWSRNKKVE